MAINRQGRQAVRQDKNRLPSLCRPCLQFLGRTRAETAPQVRTSQVHLARLWTCRNGAFKQNRLRAAFAQPGEQSSEVHDIMHGIASAGMVKLEPQLVACRDEGRSSFERKPRTGRKRFYSTVWGRVGHTHMQCIGSWRLGGLFIDCR